MGLLQSVVTRLRQFGLRRSIAVYFIIVVGLVMAGELAIDHIVRGTADGGIFPLVNAFLLAALVGVIVFFLFQGAVEGRERASIALAESEERFRSLTSLSADWFWETDAEQHLTWIAGGGPMLKLFGSELAYGRRLWEIPGVEARASELTGHLRALAAHEPFREFELRRAGGAGEGEFHLISGEPRLDSAGRFVGYRGVGHDVTDRKSAQRELSAAKERLELALNAGELAIWDSDITAGRTYLSEGWADMLGDIRSAQQMGIRDLVERIHVEDRDAALLASKRAVTGETPSFVAEMRMRRAGGDWKWIVSSGQVVERDAVGRALRMTGTVVDIDRRKRAEQATRDAELRYRTLVDLSPDGVLLQSDGLIEYANRAAALLLGASSPAALVGRSLIDLVHADYRAAILQRVEYLRAGPGATDFKLRKMLRLDGREAIVDGASVSYLERGRLVMQTVLRDVSEQTRVREELAEREQRFRDVVEAAGEYVWETDAAFRYTWLSARVESVLGYMHADLLGRRPQEFMPLGQARTVEERLMRHARQGEPFRDLVHRSITKSGRVIWQSVSGVPVFEANGTLRGYRGTGADITARKQAEERIQYLATRDALTGLPNRALLADRAEQAILNAGRNRGRIAVLSLDLGRFQLVNDSLGHQVGDALLRAIAERLANILRKDDTLARLGGDEFVLLWDGTRDVQDAALVAQKVLKSLAQPVVIDGRVLNMSVSIGIGVYPDDGRDFAELLKNADAARYAAKEAGGGTCRFFSRELNLRALERLEMESGLHRALARDEFVLHYQPVVRSAPGQAPRIVGAEVLMRWRHPDKGLLGPDEFIPFAEQIGLMGPLGEWLIERSSERIALWQDGPMAGLWFSLNVSVKEFSQDRRFAETLGQALRRNRLDGSRLALEIAERSVQGGGTESLETLQAVADLGVALTIDDFGAGQSNLAALRRLPVRKLKIDRSFVSDVATREDAAIIVQTVAAMAKGLGVEFAAAGVENKAQLARLQELGCREWQGHLYSEPLEADAFELLLTSPNRVALR